ncbi:hypothetical protein LCGC14_1656680 [marine sediment metagenome]|uniref:DUF2267 domain-containing protein n=1 Tax=marine sediment metagenome TaxID=412755 RepID=A0A0F9HVW6_9ZZZZ
MKDGAIAACSNGARQAQQWVNDLADDLNEGGERHALRLLRSVLHALRDAISLKEAADLSAQSPILVRGIFFEGWQPSATPAWNRTKGDFVARIQNDLRDDPFADTEGAIAAVLRLLDSHISEGEKTWRRLKGEDRLPMVIASVKFTDGVALTAPPERPRDPILAIAPSVSR